MSLVDCEECGYKMPDKAHACPNCGMPVPVETLEEEEQAAEAESTADTSETEDEVQAGDWDGSAGVARGTRMVGPGSLSFLLLVLGLVALWWLLGPLFETLTPRGVEELPY